MPSLICKTLVAILLTTTFNTLNFYRRFKRKSIKTDDKVIKNVTSSLEKHGMTALGENGNITLDKVSQILEMSMK